MAKIYSLLLCALFYASNALAADQVTPTAIFTSALPSVVDEMSAVLDECPVIDGPIAEFLAGLQSATTTYQDCSYASTILSSMEEYIRSINPELACAVANCLCLYVPLILAVYHLANRTATAEQAGTWIGNLLTPGHRAQKHTSRPTASRKVHKELKKGNKRNQYQSSTKKSGR